MEYKEFVDRVANEIGDKLPKSLKGAEITARQVDKLQNEGYYGITVAPKKSNIGISLDMKSAFDNFARGASFSEVLESVAQAITQGFENQPKVNAAEIQDYGAMKEKIMIQVVPIAGNEEMLATVPHVDKEDMSIVFRLVLDTNEQESATALVNNDMMKEYGISLDQLYEDAMKNAPEKFPATIRSMQEVLAEMMGIEPELLPEDPNGMYIATCNQGISGAGCIFYPDFMKQASDKFGGSFFILPSSVHEMIILPDNGLFDYKNLQNMVQEINASEVRPEDRLSDSVYHYDAEDRIFEKASNYESRQQAKSTENEKSNAKASIMGKLADKKKETISGPAEKRTASKTVENSL